MEKKKLTADIKSYKHIRHSLVKDKISYSSKIIDDDYSAILDDWYKVGKDMQEVLKNCNCNFEK